MSGFRRGGVGGDDGCGDGCSNGCDRGSDGRDRGSATAELAVVVPVVLLVLALCLGAVVSTGQYVRLVDAGADSARLVARGEGGAAERVALIDREASLVERRVDDLVCVDVTAGLEPVPGLRVPVLVSSCALAGGR